MPYLVIKSASNATPESYQLTNTWEKPRLAVKTQKASTSSYSYSVTTTALTSSSNSEGMSNTSSVSSTFTSGTQALTSGSNTFYSQNVTWTAVTTTKADSSITSKFTSHHSAIATSTSLRTLKNSVASINISGYNSYSESRWGSTISNNAWNSSYTTSYSYTRTRVTLSSVDNEAYSLYYLESYFTISPLTSSIIAETTGTSTLTGSSSYYSGAVNSTTSESASTTCYTDISSLYLPLSTDTSGAGLKVKDSGNTYRVMRTTTTSHSQSASATFLTSAANSNGMSNTTALTCSSSSGTSALTKLDAKTLFTLYGSSKCPSNTVYTTLSTWLYTATRSSSNQYSTWITGTVLRTSIWRYGVARTGGYGTVQVTGTWAQAINTEVTYAAPAQSKVATLTTGTGTLTRVSTSGYSGVSSSSSSESASITCWG